MLASLISWILLYVIYVYKTDRLTVWYHIHIIETRYNKYTLIQNKEQQLYMD